MTHKGYRLTEQHKRRIRAGLRGSKQKLGRPRTVPDRVCRACGKTFRPQQRRGIPRTGRGEQYCSQACYFTRMRRGASHHWWTPEGRTMIHWRGRPYMIVRAKPRWRLEHRVIAEQVLGRRLKSNEVVHHINGDGCDNRHGNLLICTRSYHTLLHTRIRERGRLTGA